MSEKDILDLITSEQSYRVVYFKILQLCETAIPENALIEEIRSFPQMKTAVLDARVLVKGLEDVGAIERVTSANNQKVWRITDTGKKVKKREAPEARIIDLFVREPDYLHIYLRTLYFCAIPRTREDVEVDLNKILMFKKGEIYPSYFVNNLESVGAVEWINGNWQTTLDGQKVIETSR